MYLSIKQFRSVRQMFYRNKAAYKIGMVSPKFSLYFLVHNGNSMDNRLGVLASALSPGAAGPLESKCEASLETQ